MGGCRDPRQPEDLVRLPPDWPLVAGGVLTGAGAVALVLAVVLYWWENRR